LGEIEAALARHPSVDAAVAIVDEDGSGEPRVVAYIVGKDAGAAPPAGELRDYLKRLVPEYMLPSAYVSLAALPLTANAKVDRRSLPAPGRTAYSTQAGEPPIGEVEQTLASIWRELLSVEQVGRHDNFFALGGHSLMALTLIERLRAGGFATDIT